MDIQKLIFDFQKAPSKTLKKGTYIYNAGDNPTHLYMVKSGIVGLFYNEESGHETFLRIFSNGAIFGHRSYLAQENYHATTMALNQCDLALVPIESINKQVKSDPQTLFCLAKLLATELGEAERRMSSMATQNVTKRVGETLVYLKLRYPDHKWTRKEIAEYSATTLETVTRIMTQLTQDGTIIKNGRDFEIKDLDKLIS